MLGNENKQSLRIAIVQKNFRVGDIQYNTQKILSCIDALNTANVHLLVFPELTITGYPPEDLLLRPGLYRQVEEAVNKICEKVSQFDVIIGLPRLLNGKRFNSALVLRQGKVLASYDKWVLPNFGVFDEKRYFQRGHNSTVFKTKDVNIGLTICEDIWQPEPAKAALESGAQLLININASPFHLGKMVLRETVVAARIKENRIPLIYANLVGGQDELVFDGASFVINAKQEITTRLPAFEEGIEIVSLDTKTLEVTQGNMTPHPDVNEAIYKALVLGVRDYVQKNGFSGVVIGLSGGIDSALTLVLAVEALGAKNVEAVMMPTRFTSDISLSDAELLARNLGVEYKTLPIESAFDLFLSLLSEEFAGMPVDVTEENIQARIRAVLLMALSNKKNKMVLTTGNKSEMAVGYSTLYGDMAGGFDVLKDVPKTRVFELSRYCNRDREVIPQRIIDRPPSAELRENQEDQDSLPPYEDLDEILEYYIEQDCSIEEIVAKGFDKEVVKKVARLVDVNEYKRSQAPPGVRITPRAFGRDRRYPITSGFIDS
ncbi:MAG TPA: NAD+ synthase [Gammaproteobacteria bacterium]|nr:NAD+ synthase [Gammaproteobacteria bacterium]